MKAADLKDRLSGAFTGLASGDALAGRLSVSKAPLLHGATTTWTLAVLDALLYRRPDEALAYDLALRLRVLAAPCRGAALRGGARSLAGTLRQVATALERDEDLRLCGVDDVLADGVCAALPFAFALGDQDDDVARAWVSVSTLSHRHVRVPVAGGFWLGGLRALLRDAKAPLDSVLADAAAFAKLSLVAYEETRAGVLVGSRSEAEGALVLARAAAEQAEDPRDLLAPPGYDGRDAPERMVAAALIAARLSAGALVDVVNDRWQHGRDSDVTLPLLLASHGLAQGVDRLPLVLVERARTAPWTAARAAALFSEGPPRFASSALPPLIEEELRFSRHAAASDDTMPQNTGPGSSASPTTSAPSGTSAERREQLKLL